MNDDERCMITNYLTKTINNEMGRREQLEIIRILNPDAKLCLGDTQYVFGKYMFYILYLF
jgi:hypothetical protein